MESKDLIEKVTLPMAIIVSAVILATSFYIIQINISRSNECESLSSGAKNRWNNVIGVTYGNEKWNECVVTYVDSNTGEITYTPLRLMQTIN